MEILALTDKNLGEAVSRAAAVLSAGGVVVYPTDTVYGLGVDARSPEAVERLRALKGMEAKKPISIIVKDAESVGRYGKLNDTAMEFAKKHLPGPLTLVLPALPSFPESVGLNNTIGVRVPNHEFCLKLAKAFNGPYTTTSANLAGTGSTPTTIKELMWHFGPKISEIALIIDAGELPESLPSTVVSCTGEEPRVLREGALSKEDLGLS